MAKMTLLQKLQWHFDAEKPPEWKAVLLKLSNHAEPNLYHVGYWTGTWWSTQVDDKDEIPCAWQFIITPDDLMEAGL